MPSLGNQGYLLDKIIIPYKDFKIIIKFDLNQNFFMN